LEVYSNRQRGAAKAAETRKKRCTEQLQACNTSFTWFCGVCKGQYKDETDIEENWIGCENCDSWFHWECVNLVDEPLEYVCSKCM